MDYAEYQSQIVSNEKTGEKKTIGSVSSDLIDKIKQFRDPAYTTTFLAKSKYTVRGSLAGGVIGVGVSMYYKQSLLFGALMGILAGGVIGHVIGEYLPKKTK
jgi:uncharacterized protein YqgC (DUF456 family)